MSFVVRASELAVFALFAMWLLEHYTDWRRKK